MIGRVLMCLLWLSMAVSSMVGWFTINGWLQERIDARFERKRDEINAKYDRLQAELAEAEPLDGGPDGR